MVIQAEISYSPLHGDFEEKIADFLDKLSEYPHLEIHVQPMSTLIAGEAREVFALLEKEISNAFEENQAVFSIRISNACPPNCAINP